MKKIKIFIVTTELPAEMTGAQVRNSNLIKHIPKNLFSISLFTIIDNKTKDLLPTVKKSLNIPIYSVNIKKFNFIKRFYISLMKRVIPYMEEFNKSGIQDILVKKINEENPDIIQLEQVNSYYAIKEIIPYIKKRNIKIILDAHNVEKVAFKESLKIFNIFKRVIGVWIMPNFSNIERKALRSVDHIFTCSPIDKFYITSIVNLEKITLVPNGTDIKYFYPQTIKRENILLYMGGAHYPPNNEALKYFFFYVYPILKKIKSDFKTYILCGKPPKWLKKIATKDASIILPGHVKDVREYLNMAEICIAPIKSGSGTRLKILEYMAMGKPIVATSKGAEGLSVVNNKNILIADNHIKFANKILWLFDNPNEANKIGKNSRKLVEAKYSWVNIIKSVEKVYSSLNLIT